MCDICHHDRCPSACPNARVRVVGVCSICEETIYDYEDALIVDGEAYHTECLEDLPLLDLLAMFEHDVREINEED